MSGQSKRSWRSWAPERLRHWIDRRKLEAEIDEINARFRPRITAAKTENEERLIDQEWDFLVAEHYEELGYLDTKRLAKGAAKWGVEIPADYWTTGHYSYQRYLTSGAQTKLRRATRAARREEIRWWIQVAVMPLIALISVAVALVSLFWRLKSN